MKRALIYIRVSTTKQDRDGYSVPMQKERLVSYCQAMGWVVAGVFVDPGVSGSSLDRPGLAELIRAVEAGKGDVVLVYKLDRLSRSQRNIIYLLEDVFQPAGVAFVSMQESFDTSTVYGKAMLGILSVFAQMEREVITERTMLGRSGRAEKGFFHGGGTDPIGYDYVDGQLVVNEEEAAQVRQVYELYAAGVSVSEITRRMDGCSTKHGGWHHTSTVGNVLDNPLYSGTVRFDGVAAPGVHEPIVPAALDAHVKERRARVRRAVTVDTPYLLTGLIYCAHCGARYFPNKRPNGRVVYSCHSRAKKSRKMVKDPNCKAPHYPIAELDAMVEAELLRFSDAPGLVHKKRAAESSSSEEVQRLDGEISKLMDLYQRDEITDIDQIANKIQELHRQRMGILKDNQTEANQQSFGELKSKLRNARRTWVEDESVGSRRSLLLDLVDEIQVGNSEITIEWLS